MFDQIKRNTTAVTDTAQRQDPAPGDTVGRIRAETDSTKLRQFLNRLGDE